VPWVDPETGEMTNECPGCDETRRYAEIQMREMELELRKMRARVTRAENQLEAAEVGKRDGKVWKELLGYWQLKFPERRITSKNVKSARATKVFARLDAGAQIGDFQLAIDGAHAFPYVVFGKRVKTGSPSDLAVDLEDIASIKKDKDFDWLVAAGMEAREKSKAEGRAPW
jgi:hypothetical protein